MITLTTTTHKGRNRKVLCAVYLRTYYQRDGHLDHAEHNVFDSDKPRDESAPRMLKKLFEKLHSFKNFSSLAEADQGRSSYERVYWIIRSDTFSEAR